MATTKSTKSTTRSSSRGTGHASKPWTAPQVQQMKTMMKAGKSATQIAKTLRRTPGSVRQKCHALGISFGHQTGRTATRSRRAA